eukprot:Skav204096  [mRNA]  locus=scaffold3129:467267:468314:+ [translate_table: standard]
MLSCCASNDGAAARSLPAAPSCEETVVQLKSSDDLKPQDIVGISKDTGAVELTLERPLKRLVYLRQTQGGKMGLDLSFTKAGTGQWKPSVKPWIVAINDGRVAEWNAHMPELAIAPHDRIISINSKNGSPAALVDVLGTAPEEVQLEVLHYNF